jgi:hypothetical protein
MYGRKNKNEFCSNFIIKIRTMENVIDNWTTDYHLNILMWQCEQRKTGRRG